MRTLQDIVESRCDVRVWCYRCERAAELDGDDMLALFALKGWAIDAAAARRRFACRQCGSAADVLLVAASRPVEPEQKGLSWSSQVHLWFFNQQTERKKGEPDLSRTWSPPAPVPPRTYDDALADQLLDRRRRDRYPLPRLVRFNPARPIWVNPMKRK